MSRGRRSLPTDEPHKGYAVRLRAGHARPLQAGGRFMATIVGGGVLDAPQVSSPSRVTCRAASPLAAVEACGGGKVPGRDESLPYESTIKGIRRQAAGRACPAPTNAGELAATIVGGGVLDAPQVSSPSRVLCRAASPLAAVAVCGGGRVPGRDESLPYKQKSKSRSTRGGSCCMDKITYSSCWRPSCAGRGPECACGCAGSRG